MNSITHIKNIFLKTIAILVMIFAFSVSAVYAQETSPLEVVFETNPLFSEIAVLPGDGITKEVTVTNNAEEDQDVIMEAINAIDSDGLGDELSLIISENSIELYNGTLGDFMRMGEASLSTITGGNTTTYSLSVSFKEGADNFTQSGTLGFDLCVGFSGGESNCGDTKIGGEGNTDDNETGNDGEGETIIGSGGGGGIFNTTSLKIENERVTDVAVINSGTEGTATVKWDTNLLATSQVIYGPATDGIGGPELFYSLNLTVTPYFGYPYATNEDPVKMAQHTLVLDGLLPNQTYKYRVVSRASPPTVSYEHTFIANSGVKIISANIPTKAESTMEAFTVSETVKVNSSTGISISNAFGTLEALSGNNTGGDSAGEVAPEPEVKNFEGDTDPTINNNQAAATFLTFSNFSAKYGLYLLLILLALFIARSIWKKLNSKTQP